MFLPSVRAAAGAPAPNAAMPCPPEPRMATPCRPKSSTMAAPSCPELHRRAPKEVHAPPAGARSGRGRARWGFTRLPRPRTRPPPASVRGRRKVDVFFFVFLAVLSFCPLTHEAQFEVR